MSNSRMIKWLKLWLPKHRITHTNRKFGRYSIFGCVWFLIKNEWFNPNYSSNIITLQLSECKYYADLLPLLADKSILYYNKSLSQVRICPQNMSRRLIKRCVSENSTPVYFTHVNYFLSTVNSYPSWNYFKKKFVKPQGSALLLTLPVMACYEWRADFESDGDFIIFCLE